jgi:hypothetical protein
MQCPERENTHRLKDVTYDGARFFRDTEKKAIVVLPTKRGGGWLIFFSEAAIEELRVILKIRVKIITLMCRSEATITEICNLEELLLDS